MTKYKVQSLRSLREEMKAVARGEGSAPSDAGKASFSSVDAVVRLLTPENRQLLAIIRDRKPQSVTNSLLYRVPVTRVENADVPFTPPRRSRLVLHSDRAGRQ